MSNVAHVRPQRRLEQNSQTATSQPGATNMASKPQYESVDIIQNGVLKRIIVPTPANKSVASRSEVAQIIGTSVTQANAQSVPQISQESRQPVGTQIYAPYLNRTMGATERPASPNLLQARTRLATALSGNKVYFTTSQGVGSLNTIVGPTNLTTTPASTGAQIALQTSSRQSATGHVPVLVMQGQQPTLIQSPQQVLLTNTQQGQVVMNAHGRPAFVLNTGVQGQSLSNNTVQLVNSGGVLTNGLLIRTAHGTANVGQLAGQNIVFQVPAQTLSNQSTASCPSHVASATSVDAATSKASLDTTTAEEDVKPFGDIQIGSVFSLRDKVNNPYDTDYLSKIITIEPEDSDETVNVEDDDSTTEQNNTYQSSLLTQSQALNLENMQQQAEYQVLAEWDQETLDEESINGDTSVRSESSFLAGPEATVGPTQPPQQANTTDLTFPENNSGAPVNRNHTQNGVPLMKDLVSGKIQLAPKETKQVTSKQVASTLKSIFKSPASGSVVAQLPDGRILLVTPSGSHTTLAKEVKAPAQQSVNRGEKDLSTDRPTTVRDLSSNSRNIVKVQKISPDKSSTFTKKDIPATNSNKKTDDMNRRKEDLSPSYVKKKLSISVSESGTKIISPSSTSPTKKTIGNGDTTDNSSASESDLKAKVTPAKAQSDDGTISDASRTSVSPLLPDPDSTSPPSPITPSDKSPGAGDQETVNRVLQPAVGSETNSCEKRDIQEMEKSRGSVSAGTRSKSTDEETADTELQDISSGEKTLPTVKEGNKKTMKPGDLVSVSISSSSKKEGGYTSTDDDDAQHSRHTVSSGDSMENTRGSVIDTDMPGDKDMHAVNSVENVDSATVTIKEDVCSTENQTKTIHVGSTRKDTFKVEEVMSNVNKAKRTKRPKRNLSLSYVRLLKMRLGKKTNVQLKKCLIPAIRVTYQAKPKPTSTNVFHIPDYIPSALDLKAEAEAEKEAELRELAAVKEREKRERKANANSDSPRTEVRARNKSASSPKTNKSDNSKQEKDSRVSIAVQGKNEEDSKLNKSKGAVSPKEKMDIVSKHENSDQASTTVEPDNDGKESEQKKFFLVKTSTGSYLVPMNGSKTSAVDLAKKAQESLEKYLVAASDTESKPSKTVPSAQSRQGRSCSSDNTSVSKLNKEEKSPAPKTPDEECTDSKTPNKGFSSKSELPKAKRSVSPKRSAPESSTDYPPPTKMARLSEKAENKDKPKTTVDRIKELKEKLKKQQEELEAIRKKNLLKTSLSEYDDL